MSSLPVELTVIWNGDFSIDNPAHNKGKHTQMHEHLCRHRHTHVHTCTSTHGHTHTHISSFHISRSIIEEHIEFTCLLQTHLNTHVHAHIDTLQSCCFPIVALGAHLHGNRRVVCWGAASIPWCCHVVVNFTTSSHTLSFCLPVCLSSTSLLSFCLFSNSLNLVFSLPFKHNVPQFCCFYYFDTSLWVWQSFSLRLHCLSPLFYSFSKAHWHKFHFSQDHYRHKREYFYL